MKNIVIVHNRGVAIIFVLVMLSIFFFAIIVSINTSFQSYKIMDNTIKRGSLEGILEQALFDAKIHIKKYSNQDKILDIWVDLDGKKKEVMSLNGFSSYSNDVDFYKNFGVDDQESINERQNKLGLWINRKYFKPTRIRRGYKYEIPNAKFVYLRREEPIAKLAGLVYKTIPYMRYAWSVYRISNSFDINYHRGNCIEGDYRFDIRHKQWDSWDTKNISVNKAFESKLFNRNLDVPWLSIDHALAAIPEKNRLEDRWVFRQAMTDKLLEALPEMDVSKKLDMGRIGKETSDGIRTVSHIAWSKVPMLTKNGGRYDHLKDQIKANIIDYCDENYYATTDITTSDFSNLNKKSAYMGNEAVHNISEVLINFANRTDREDECSLLLGAYVELQNMYGKYPLGEARIVLIVDIEVYLLESGGFEKVKDERYTFSRNVSRIGQGDKIRKIRLKSENKELLNIWNSDNGIVVRKNAKLKIKQVRVALIEERDNQYLDFVDIENNRTYHASVKKGVNINFRPYDIRVNHKKSDFYTATGNYGFFDSRVPEGKLLSKANDLGKLNKKKIPKKFNSSGREVYYFRDAEKALDKSTVNFSDFSTSHFRNKPWETTNQLFELGAISRGESLRTINLIEYNPNTRDLGEFRTAQDRIIKQKLHYANCGDRGLLRYMYVNEETRENPSYKAQERIPILPSNIMWNTPFRAVFEGKKFIMKHGSYRQMTKWEVETAKKRATVGRIIFDDDFFDYKERTGGQYGIFFNVHNFNVKENVREYNNDFLNEQLLMSTKDYFSNRIEYFYVVAVVQGLTYSQNHTGNRSVKSSEGDIDTFFIDSEVRIRALYGYNRIDDKFRLIEYKEF